jgi:hypothetical protein
MHTAQTPTPPANLGNLTTIGAHQPEVWQIVTRMVREQGWHLVDIRSVSSSPGVPERSHEHEPRPLR